MASSDIMVDSAGTPVIKNGDYVVGDSEAQHLEHLLKAFPGSYKAHPLTGIGAPAWQNARVGLGRIEGDVKLQLKADGWIKEQVLVNGTDISIQAERADENS
ncbi:MAG: hypothetical protein F9K23_00670 [Bacteroidetes bacterium]|nr:MAG: hypothetical protein F9K23_00670 [Bacteroidota bacterium]